MKELNRLVPVLAGVLAVTGAPLLAIGCGSTSTSPPADGGGMDSTTDSTTVDGGGADSSADVLFQTDVVQDTGGDAQLGAPEDGGSDADTGIADAGILPTAQTFPSLLTAVFCNVVATCCGTSPDAATFNWQSCYNSVLVTGFKGVNTTGANLVDGGHITFDVAQAQACLNTLASADCSSNQITSAEESQLFQSCFAAYGGTLATGSPCAGTLECAPGNFCMPVDGGVGDAGAIGSCQPLAGVGGACGFLGGQAVGQTVCSYRGSASNGLFCQNISGDAGVTQLNPAQWTCQPQWANGSDCYSNPDCTSKLCVEIGTTDSFQCASGGDWIYPNTCAEYVTPVDAGGGD